MGIVEQYCEDWQRENWTVTDRHGIAVYVDDDRLCPAATSIIEQMMRRGKIHPPVFGTDGYERRAERPEIVFWYARILGELVHDRIAGQMDDTYEQDTQGIVRRIRRLDGLPDDIDERDVLSELYQYRGEGSIIRSDLITHVEYDLDSLMEAWDQWPQRSFWKPIRAEYGLVAENFKWDEGAWGVRPDLIAYKHGDVVAYCIKTASQITDAHRLQGVVTYHSSMDIDRVEIVRLDREREWCETETISPRSDPSLSMLADFLDEAVKMFRSVN